MFQILITAASVLFALHVILLLGSFSRKKVLAKRYFYSHVSLWLAGIAVFALATICHGTQRSGFLDFFDTTFRRIMILGFTLFLSAVAHVIVRLLVLPIIRRP
ncbi:hypothetical protein GWR56_10615 [Mucilaginibacter sp. 14171R-50]|uniref:hypothetical protein n=1 Tax=Mucilaginibacter sp. 14171R-50 TaxID=2703789 RepID=UPI00138BDCB6|nr:hypothetical protein [Mucilaginibacter sp. 14171R-50]QHS55965.1 hypothetical protein GWR56_10615 [Mucilaginibacter sp. 14171R-50]